MSTTNASVTELLERTPDELLVTSSLTRQAAREFPDDLGGGWRNYFEAHQDVLDAFDGSLQDVIQARQLPHATGRDLEIVGEGMSETLGKRRKRGDTTYRNYLRALPTAFGGRGTESDIEFALASGVFAERPDILLTERVEVNGYEVEIRDWQAHTLSLIDTLCDYADAPGISRKGPIRYQCEEAVTKAGPREARSGVRHKSPPAVTHAGPSESGIRVKCEDGFGGFQADDGARFDLSDIQPTTSAGVEAGKTYYVPPSATESVSSPYAVGGELGVDGELGVVGGDETE